MDSQHYPQSVKFVDLATEDGDWNLDLLTNLLPHNIVE